VAEVLTAFLCIQDPLHDETEEAIEAAFDDLEVSLGRSAPLANTRPATLPGATVKWRDTCRQGSHPRSS
jgi:hypothetical protein